MIDWTWQSPGWLHLLWLAVAFVALLGWLELRGRELLSRVVSRTMMERLATRVSFERRIARLATMFACLCLAILALARPQTAGDIEAVSSHKVSADIMVVLDVSRSMLADDAAPNRLARAKAEIEGLLDELEGHRVGLVAFAGEATVLSPLTPDYSFFRMMLRGADPTSISRGGTRIGEAIRKGLEAFDEDSSVSKLMLLITDGEDHDSYPLEAAKEAAKKGVRIVAIGFGSEKGSEISLTDPVTGAKTTLTYEGKPVISKLDGKTLRDIALETKGAFVPAGVAALDLEVDRRSAYRAHGRGRTGLERARSSRRALSLVSRSVAAGAARDGGAWCGAQGGRGMRHLALAISVALMVPACSAGGESSARKRYNEGVAALSKGDAEEASKAFLEARDQARGDGTLRFDAAYNLGLAHAAIADSKKDDQEAALESLRASAGWFRDAVRLRPEDEASRANLEIVLRRAQVLADQINKGKNGLEARLDRLIADQRSLRDDVRALVEQLGDASATAEPAAFSETFEELAANERALYAETGTVVDLAADELGLIGQKKDDELTQQDRVRQAQLQALDRYLQAARVSLDDVRRTLRKLDAPASHEQATVALERLKRAREQLLDPVAALQAASQDEMLLLQHTAMLAMSGKKGLSLEGAEATPEAAPSWLTPAHLAGRQRDIRERVADLTARFRAAVQSPPPAKPDDKPNPDAEKALAAAKEALPHLDDALKGMEATTSALDSKLLEQATDKEREVLAALFAAMERFAGLRQLIELAYGEQAQVVALLDPKAEATKDLTTQERATKLGESLGRNVDRLTRLESLLGEEKARLLEQAQPQQGQPQQQPPQNDEQVAQQKAAIEAQFQAAEQHRKAALEATESLKALAARAVRGGQGGNAQQLAQTAQHEIEELRRIFFSIIEHLKDLLKRQGDTHDKTAEAQGKIGDDFLELLGPATDAQTEHAQLADSLAEALAKQADDAAASQDKKAAEQADRLGRAADEVRQAAAAMHQAQDTMTRARDDASSMSVDLKPAVEQQPIAMQHLEEAIKILEPPKQQPKDDKQQQNQQQQQQQQVSKDQAARKLQAIREREAKRRKEKRGQPQTQSVDKDW